MGVDAVRPNVNEARIAVDSTPISDLISVAETIEQIVYIAHRIRREKPGGQEWNQLNKRAEFIIDGYVKQIQENPKKLNALREDVAHFNEINLLDVTEIQTAINKLNTAADEAKQREIAAAQELPPFIQEARTIAQIVSLATEAEKNGQKNVVWPQLKKRAEQIIEAYKTQIQADPSRVNPIKFDLLSLKGTTLFSEYEINQLLTQLR
ncbi:hypothetical protein KA078_00730 [Candidatus Woesebacteria bacterium]|nr:hypothetical protein [Candidatus Woesebacteria bacterium]